MWADLGAGSGTFTAALARLLGPSGRVIAIDADARAIASVRELSKQTTPDRARIDAAVGDFTRLADVDVLRDVEFDGALLANALHFTRDPRRVIEDVATRVRRGGRLIVVEYEGRAANPWVPYPLDRARVREIASELGLGAPQPLGERRSRYGGVMYAVSLAR